MCDQTEVIYSPGDIVWVKLGPVWWPGQVFDYDKLPDEISSNLRKKPIAVVKFFQEESYEYVKNLNSIYHYNCRKKHEFIKKGLDMCRSNNREVPSNMKMFPNDIATAEHLTNGNPNILDEEEFAPEEKGDYSELFGKKTPKRAKTDSVKKEGNSWRVKPLSEPSLKNRRSLPTPTVPRPITHPRFITKALEGRSDHEVRIRQQSGSERGLDGLHKQYNCHLCGFSSTRINVIVYHNKSHSAGYADAFLPSHQLTGSNRKHKSERKISYNSEKRQRVSNLTKSGEPLLKRKSVKLSVESPSISKPDAIDRSRKFNDAPSKSASPVKKPIFGRKKTARDKAEKIAKEKQQNDAFRETLLKDWDDEDVDEDDDDDEKVDVSKEDESKEKDSTLDSSPSVSDKKIGSDSKAKDKSCFDFDDSEDGLNIGETVMKFGQKIPRVLGDKPKKQTKQSLSEQSPKKLVNRSEKKLDRLSDDADAHVDITDEVSSVETPVGRELACVEPNVDSKENEDLDLAFKALLNETSVPLIPDAPNHHEIKNKSIDLDLSATDDQFRDDGGGGDDGGGLDRVKEDNSNQEDISNSLTHTKSSEEGDIIVQENSAEDKDTTCSTTEHFLVKTSEEVATSSSDDTLLEENASHNGTNVALTKSDVGSNIYPKEEPAETLTSGDISNIGKDTKIDNVLENGKNIVKTFPPSFTNVSNINDDPKLQMLNDEVKETKQEKVDEIIGSIKNELLTTAASKETSINTTVKEEVVTTVMTSGALAVDNKIESHPAVVSEASSFQEMDFDINSMPVIIGDDMVQDSHSTVTATSVNKSNSISTAKLAADKSEICTNSENKLITVKGVTKQLKVDTAVSGNLPMVIKEESSSGISQLNVSGKEGRVSTRKVLLSPTKTVAASRSQQLTTIKVQPTTATSVNKLTVPGGIITQKGTGNTSQVLILKSATPHGQLGKQTLQKIGNTSQMIQQGGKVLILTNPQGGAGQNKILSTLTTQQKTPSKITGTRILTTKGTVLTTGTQAVISKANILSGSSKTVTTKSGQKILINKGGVISPTQKSVIINKSGVLTTVSSPTFVSTGKGSLITQNILTNKAESAVTQISPSQITVGNKGGTATIFAAPGLTTSKGMILTPVTTSKGAQLATNQKLRLITSKGSPAAIATGVATSPSTAGGTKLVFQSSQSRMILPSSSVPKNQQLKLVSGLKGQTNTGTILIQTSQGVIATTPLPSGQVINKKQTKSSLTGLSSLSTALTPKTTTIQVAQPLAQPQNKLVVQKVKPAGPNILQKTQKKPVQRGNKKNLMSQPIVTTVSTTQNLQSRSSMAVNQLATGVTAGETLILSSPSGLPVIGQSSIVQGSQLDSSNQTLVYLTVDESGNYRPLEPTPVVNYEGATSDSQTLYIDPATTDLDNIFLTIDDAGNVVNISQPVQNTFKTENSVSAAAPPSAGQDILAKALANTQVLQQESIAGENIPLTSSVESSIIGGCMFVEPQTQFPQPSLSHSVLETSLTLNQPIMTPLEVPSAVSPRGLDQISSLQTGFLSDSSLLRSSKDKKGNMHPSMPLLTEEPDCSASGNIDGKSETVFFTQVGDGSHAVLTPVTSGSQLAFQLSLDENNVIVSSSPSISQLGVISSTNLPPTSLTYIPQSNSSSVNTEQKSLIEVSNSATSSSTFTSVSQHENFQLSDKLLGNKHLNVSNNSEPSDANEAYVLEVPDENLTQTSVVFETETKDEIQHFKEEQVDVSDYITKKSVAEETVHQDIVSTHDASSNRQNVSQDVFSDTSGADDKCSEVVTDGMIDADPNVENEKEPHKTDNGTKTDSSINIEEGVSTTVTDVFTSATETTVSNSCGDIFHASRKRHFEYEDSSDSNLSEMFQSKKIKLEER